MHGIGVFDLNQQVYQRLKSAFGEEDGELQLPNDEWGALALINSIRQDHS